jgi:pimeloyl-ACP methyl ester carboxylesterase
MRSPCPVSSLGTRTAPRSPCAHAAVDARPDRIAGVVYRDAGPLGDGGVKNDEFPAVNGDVPLPDWSEFGKEELVDLDEERRARLRSIAIPSPVHVARDQQVLRDPRRYDVPATVINCEFSSDLMRKWLSEGHPFMAELGKVKDYELVDLPTGHWPQITRPTELAGGFPAQRSVGREGFEPP